MDKDISRMTYIYQQFNNYGIDFKRFSAVDGNKLTHIDTNLRKGQLGCYISHLQTYKEIISHGWERTLILEDDITLTPWINRIDEFISTIPDGWDIIWVGQCRSKWPRNCCSLINNPEYDLSDMTKINDNIYKFSGKSKNNHPMGGYAYLISLQGAKKMLDLKHDFTQPIDNMMIKNSLEKYIIIPSLIIHCYNFQSNISVNADYKSLTKLSEDISFDHIWSKHPNMEKTLFKMLKEFHELTKSIGVRYCIAFGTLLGYYRTQSIIPWDDDVDLRVYKEDIPKLIKAVFQHKFLRASKMNLKGCPLLRYKIFSDSGIDHKINNSFWKWPFLDIWEFDLSHLDSIITIPVNCFKTKTIKLNQPFKTEEKILYSADRKNKTISTGP